MLPRQCDRYTGMFRVLKDLDMHQQPQCGVVPLSRIVGLCPLSPVFEGPCDPTITSATSLDTFSEFWVNHYSSRIYYQLLQ